MDLEKIVDKAKNGATVAFDFSCKKGKEVFEVSKSNIKIFDLTTEVEKTYKEIGKLVYSSQTGSEIDVTLIEEKVAYITKIEQEIAELKIKKDDIKNTVVCDSCNTIGRRDDKNCTQCGTRL